MQRISRSLALLALLVAALALVACGGGDEDTGGQPVESEDVNTILEQTFSDEGDKKVDSGQISLDLELNATGGGSTLQGPVNVSLGGAFQSRGEKEVPEFDMDLTFEGAGQNIEAGLTSTGDEGFVSLKLPGEDSVTDYAVSEEVFQQFKAGFEQASEEQESNEELSLTSLGIQPQDWLIDPANEGDSDVGGTETIRITGDVDVPKMLEDVNTLLSKAGSLGVPDTGQLPSELTEEQIAQVEEAVKSASVEIETGKDDSILRRMAFTLALEDPAGSGGSADVSFDLTLTELNEDQDISAPEDPKPFEDLAGSLGGLGGLGALGGASAGGGADSAATQEYTDCVAEAGSDVQKAQQCAELLAP